MSEHGHGRVREHSRGSEAAAFEKLKQGLRYAIEASTELGVLRGQREFMLVAITIEKVLAAVTQLSLKGRIDRIIRP